MDLIWWLPAMVMALGALILLARIRVIDREIANTAAASARLGALAEGGAILAAAVTETQARRGRTLHALTGESASPADREHNGAGR